MFIVRLFHANGTAINLTVKARSESEATRVASKRAGKGYYPSIVLPA